MAKRIKTVRAGRLVIGVCYSQAAGADAPKARAAKTRCSSMARRALNFRAAWQKLRMELCANVGRGDLWVTLGYDDAHLPDTRKKAKANMAAFMDRLRAARRKAGEELLYFYITEELQDDGSRRLHHHLVLRAGAERRDYELIRSLWTQGSNIEIRRLGEHELYSDDFLELAQYMCKERNPEAKTYNVGDKCWVSSRNIAKPETVSELVPDNVTITAPPGARILDQDHKSNEFGSYDYIAYILPELPTAAQKKPKRGRKSQKDFKNSVSGLCIS